MTIRTDGLCGFLSMQKTTINKTSVQLEDCTDNQLSKAFDTLLKQNKFVQDKNLHEDSSLMYMVKEVLEESAEQTILYESMEHLNEVIDQDSLDKIMELETSEEIVEKI
ncbi:hypothetical protein [Bartonella sp. JB63]|uniref:hypothetical protein n=1 Tax=Bartonella sp. JB63 TaxID=1933907 RepID=UPI00099A4934|nr:hypothetical protein [Bartonella sp. JB63]AQX29026.1 hypothetical protein BJB63x_003320 [Bartonella sp. JB63]